MVYIKQESCTLQSEDVTIKEEDVKVDPNTYEGLVKISDNKCATCGVWVDDQRVDEHVCKHCNDQQTCDECDISFSNIESYRQHLLEHSESLVYEYYQCKNCRAKFYCKSLYDVHRKTVCFINRSVQIQKHIFAALDVLKKKKEETSPPVLCEIKSEEATLNRDQELQCSEGTDHLSNDNVISSIIDSNLHQEEEIKIPCVDTNFEPAVEGLQNKENLEVDTCAIKEEISFPLLGHMNSKDRKDPSVKLDHQLEELKVIYGPGNNSVCIQNSSPVSKLKQPTKLKKIKGPGMLDEANDGSEMKGQVCKRRLRSNSEPDIYPCTQCSHKCSDLKNYLKHMYNHRTKQCTICKRYVSAHNYRNHVKTHSSEPQMCHLCGFILKSKASLHSHIAKTHFKQGHKCNECGKLFGKRGERDSHRKQDHSWKPTFCCETCGKCFYANKDLQKHLNMTHLKLRPHVCEFCNRGFSSAYAMRTHRRQHTKETPFKCEECGQGYRHNVSLKGHLKSKHHIEEPKTCKCQVCGKGFASEMSLHAHKRVH